MRCFLAILLTLSVFAGPGLGASTVAHAEENYADIYLQRLAVGVKSGLSPMEEKFRLKYSQLNAPRPRRTGKNRQAIAQFAQRVQALLDENFKTQITLRDYGDSRTKETLSTTLCSKGDLSIVSETAFIRDEANNQLETIRTTSARLQF